MSEKVLTRKTMTEKQVACFDLLCEVFRGEHHAPDKIYEWGNGIRCSTWTSLSTFDFDYLTRLVVLAHDRCIRVELVQSGPRRIGIVLHKREGRDGQVRARHPTIEDAIAKVRAGRAP